MGFYSLLSTSKKYAQSYSRKPALIEYHVSSDGSHRTLWATLVGADYIRARVYSTSYNLFKNENYKRVQSNLCD